MNFNISPVSTALAQGLKHKIDFKTKPTGALGSLEEIAMKIGTIQNTLSPSLHRPAIIVFAGDHGIAADGTVNPYPQAVTYQMVYNFLNGGAAINVFAKQNHLDIKVVDAGVKHDFPVHSGLINAKIDRGTKNYLHEPAMSGDQCKQAIQKGAAIVKEMHHNGCNVIGFGEMGIGNTSSAAILMHLLTGIPMNECVGKGTGLDENGLEKKRQVLTQGIKKHPDVNTPLAVLSTFGGFEIAMICGAILQAAELKMLIIIDGFIVTSALLVACKIHTDVADYCLFAHSSEEKGHVQLLEYLKGKPILSLNMRLGEGTGAAIAYPIIQAAVNFLNEMASFESAGVSNKE